MELKNLQEIFNEKFFRIPDYQRGYSWGDKQLNDLWRDMDILETDKYHYTGVLSVVRKEGNGGGTVFVVDGQQRITSLIILIQAICNRALADKHEWINGQATADYVKKYLHKRRGSQGEITEPIFGYEKDNPSHVHFKKNILGLSDMESDVPPRTLYTRNLDNAKEFFDGKLSDMQFEDMEILLAKATEKLKFNYYLIDDELNEFVAFESMNNRGKPLSDLELLKNRLIYLSTLLPCDEEERAVLRKAVNDAWKTVYEYLGKNPGKALNDDTFLRDHWIMNFPYSREEARAYKEFLLNQHFTAERIRSGALAYSDIKEYAEDIQKAVKPFYSLYHPQASGYSEEIKKWLLKLNRLNFGAFRPLLMSAFMRGGDDSQIINLLKAAERFLFVAFDVEGRMSHYKNSDIYRAARDYHRMTQSHLSVVVSGLPGVRAFSTERFVEKIQENENDFYAWRGIKYFLYEYELYLQRKHGGETKLEYVNADTIEHIFPQTPGEGWERFDQGDLLHDLGNLLLLSKSHNPKLGNRPFSEKKEVFRRASYSAIEISDYSDWTPESVNDRREKLLAFLVERWNLIPYN